MAEKVEQKSKSLEDMEKEITCAICQEYYTEPKVLPCLHYYCKKCMLKLALTTASSKPFSCPDCQVEATFPEGGVDELKTAFFISRLKCNYYSLKSVHSKVEIKCEGCVDCNDTAESYCRQCSAFICMKSIESHQALKIFSSHEVTSLEDLKQGRAPEIALKEPPTQKCDLHKEPLTVFCFDCSSLICRDCTVITHRDHSFEFSKIAAPSIKKKLLAYLASLENVADVLSGGIKDIEAIRLEIEDQGSSVVSTINNSFTELQEILEKHKQHLLREATRKVNEKIEKLAVQEKSLSQAMTDVRNIVECTERFLGHCSDNEVMNMHVEIRKHIKRSKTEYSKSKMTIVPSEEADLGVVVVSPGSLYQLCQTETRITRLPLDLAQCTVTGKGLHTAELSQTTDLVLTTNLSNGKKTNPGMLNIAGELKSLYYKSLIQCNVDQLGAGKYRIRYTPTVRGRHQLTVFVGGQQVTDTPFTVSVSISPTQLEHPVKLVTGLPAPTHVTLNSEGDLLVCLGCSGLVKLDKKGKKHKLVDFKRKKLYYWAFAVATDNEDNMYIVSVVSNSILHCDQNGNNMKVIIVQQQHQGKGRGHSGIAVVGEEVIVTERDSVSVIVVYDKQFRCVRCIQQPGYRIYRRLHASVLDDNLYATASDNLVHVFSKDGSLLRTIGCDDTGVNRLNGPTDVCTSGDHVYVSNYDGHDVSVFTTSGDYVTSFGRPGNRNGELAKPISLTVDFCSFVTVVEYDNNRVQYF